MTDDEITLILEAVIPALKAHVREFVQTRVDGLELKAGPAGLDGLQGQDGRDGLDGKDGGIGPQGERGEIGPAGPSGEKGMDGLSGKDGRDGLDGKDGAIGLTGPVGPQGPQGLLGEKGLTGERGERGADGRDGKDGKDGRDGKDGIGLPGEKGLDGLDGKDGRDGFGFDDLTVEHDGERTVTLVYKRGELVKSFEIVFPVSIYRGVFDAAKAYEKGDVVTWGGHAWTALLNTLEQPGLTQKSSDWQLTVKAGRDGKPGKA